MNRLAKRLLIVTTNLNLVWQIADDLSNFPPAKHSHYMVCSCIHIYIHILYNIRVICIVNCKVNMPFIPTRLTYVTFYWLNLFLHLCIIIVLFMCGISHCIATILLSHKLTYECEQCYTHKGNLHCIVSAYCDIDLWTTFLAFLIYHALASALLKVTSRVSKRLSMIAWILPWISHIHSVLRYLATSTCFTTILSLKNGYNNLFAVLTNDFIVCFWLACLV